MTFLQLISQAPQAVQACASFIMPSEQESFPSETSRAMFSIP